MNGLKAIIRWLVGPPNHSIKSYFQTAKSSPKPIPEGFGAYLLPFQKSSGIIGSHLKWGPFWGPNYRTLEKWGPFRGNRRSSTCSQA